MSRSSAAWLIIVLVFLWCTASNLQLGHRVTDLEIQNRALRQMVKECGRSGSAGTMRFKWASGTIGGRPFFWGTP